MNKTIYEAASSGDQLATLTVLRDRLAGDLDKITQPHMVASLTLRLTDVMAQIRELTPVIEQESLADEIAERRAARRRTRSKRSSRATRAG